MSGASLRMFGSDFGGGYLGSGTAKVMFQPVTAATIFALRLAAALLRSILPAPAAALKNAGNVLDPHALMPWRPAVVLLLLGGGAALLPAVGNLPVFAFVRMALLLAGGIAGVPWLVRWLLWPWRGREIASASRLLAIRHVQDAPSQAAIALCGIVASTALVIVMATMVSSFRTADDSWLGQVLSAVLYQCAEGGDLNTAAQRRIAAVPGTGQVVFSR